MSSSNDASSCFSSWLTPFYDCFSPREEDRRRYSRRIGVEREMKICHNQPHLVPPMKLVLYDDMPPTPQPPPPSHLAHLVAQGRILASRASERASVSVRKKTLARPSISDPIPIDSPNGLPFRRRNQYRPLELSIYMPDNRLSDLPDFDILDFDVIGKIQLPTKALIRSRSEEQLNYSPNLPMPRNPTTSMVGERQLDYWQRRRSSSVITTSRPPSAHDTFHSHPVVWSALPGLPAQAHYRQPDQGNGVTVLSPMQEEFTPVEERKMDHVIDFPQEEEDSLIQAPQSRPEGFTTEDRQPFKLNKPPTSQSYRTRSRSQPRTSSFNRNRVSQWLSRSASTTVAASTPPLHPSGTQISEFHQYAATPLGHAHSRSRTLSSSTVATSILSGAETPTSLTSMTTAPTVQDLRSRSNTAKSLEKKVIVLEQELPPYVLDGSDHVLEAVRVKAPAIGMAF